MISLEKGKRSRDLEKYGELLFSCLSGIEQLKAPMFIRIFSKRYLGSSKVFEVRLKTRVISIARKYYPLVDEEMDDYQVLAQLYLDNYAQEMAVKGELRLYFDGNEIDLYPFPYGLILNSETLERARISKDQRIRKVITVENKANFVHMPRERDFLKRLEQTLEEYDGIQYFHTGDLDYGGVRIFQYIRTQIFPKLQPLWMDAEQFEAYKEFGETMKEGTWEKLKSFQEPRLQILIDKMLETKLVIEQECFCFPKMGEDEE